jgi:hypothetical protein
MKEDERGSEKTPPHLVVLSGANKGDVIILDDGLPVVFGSQAGVSLPEPELAPVHCQVVQAEGRWFLQDFGSKEGTWLGDDRIEGVRPLEFGRSFRIGETHVALLESAVDDPLDSASALEVLMGSSTDVLDIQTPPPATGRKAPVPVGLPALSPLAVHDALGDYDIVGVLGGGNLGTVYKGYDRRRRRVVALKVLSAELAQDPNVVARFLRGAKTGGRLSHRHIVKVLGAGHAAGRIYVTMEFVEGLNLEQFCEASGGRLIPPVALGIMNRITAALVFAHGREIVHRNVSPQNILIGPGGSPKLADLALAKRSTVKKVSMTITSKGQVLTASVFSSPEAVLGEPMDVRSDVWGVGATLFRALTDRAPYGNDPKKLTQRIMTADREDSKTLLRNVSPELHSLLKRCLEPNPDQRYQHMRDLREAIAELPEIA